MSDELNIRIRREFDGALSRVGFPPIVMDPGIRDSLFLNGLVMWDDAKTAEEPYILLAEIVLRNLVSYTRLSPDVLFRAVMSNMETENMPDSLHFFPGKSPVFFLAGVCKLFAQNTHNSVDHLFSRCFTRPRINNIGQIVTSMVKMVISVQEMTATIGSVQEARELCRSVSFLLNQYRISLLEHDADLAPLDSKPGYSGIASS